MPCWALFYTTNQRKEKDRQSSKHETVEEEIAPKTPSVIADLPSITVKSIGLDQDTSLSKPISSSAFEWDTLNRNKQCVNQAASNRVSRESKISSKVTSSPNADSKVNAKKAKDGKNEKVDKKNHGGKAPGKESKLSKILRKFTKK